ncbi:transglutaminase-like domain-containing protein [Aristaeella hokkaidonensis]|uniref:Transglutaminase domain-containing protein n=1 Tax=Aristaeella hokkaidonensis TaxID=3046382 RepID=A0AC61MZ35_9FIRM|nr:transglutaminase-like domain-containing protein [Aristaeella hokkaidonensis]QUC68462.1 transglutaminase domain-containing protein [Aristaeella hokkaidonensis]SNT94933.1 Transglutaminase-like superfamily protein [Aristaeella hokkaidonensis]
MIARMGKTRFIICAALVLVVCAAVIVAACGLNLPEATGQTVKKDGKMTIDCSNMSEGYIMVKAKKTTKRLKLQIATSGAKLNYDLNSDGEYEVFPLQFGNGKYQISLFENVSGKKYSKEGTVKLSVKMPDELSCFLYPNQYVSYNENTACVQQAEKLCEGMTDQTEIYGTICKYVLKNFVYDYIKSVTVKPGLLPQIDDCWNNKMGICQDLAAMTCAMLRSQGVPARLMIGTVGSNTYHAWVVAVVNGKNEFFDPTAEMNASSKTDAYTTERYY